MGRQDGVKGIRHKEVCVCTIGLMHVYYSMSFYYLLLFVIHLLLLDKLGYLLMYLGLSVMRASQLNSHIMSDCMFLDWEVASQLGNY